MDRLTGRPDHIMDYLVTVRTGQWYGWAKGAEPRMVYANLIVNDGGSKPTEQECIDGLAALQTTFDPKCLREIFQWDLHAEILRY